jgi:hypothetical protein
VKTRTALAAALVGFALLATANSAGYRYGVSDQAFYVPAVLKSLHPTLYPRDSVLLATQTHFTLADDGLAAIARLTGAGLPAIFVVVYALTLAGLFAAAVALARGLRVSWWTTATFLLLLTFRHRIARTGANSLEGYMHPRMIAFALGVAALAAIVRGRYRWAFVWIGAAALIHPTTALWFALAAGAALLVGQPAWRRVLVPVAALAAAAAGWAVLAGPLTGRLGIMDPAWLAVLAQKDYLFPSAWPPSAWAINLAYPVVIVLVYRRRRSRGLLAPGEPALVAGMLALVAVFLISVPFSAAHVALAVQLQVNRVFWLTDVVTAAYVAWWLAEDLVRRRAAGRVLLVALLAAASVGRGVYVLHAASRPLVQVDLPATPWVEAMTWLRTQPASWLVLADPDHGWKYGISVRVAAERDTVLETGKDSAMAMYDRAIAMRVADRMTALAGFDRLSAADARALAARYGADVLVASATRTIMLPVLYRNGQFTIYDLR